MAITKRKVLLAGIENGLTSIKELKANSAFAQEPGTLHKVDGATDFPCVSVGVIAGGVVNSTRLNQRL
jgi:hypothetical protein